MAKEPKLKFPKSLAVCADKYYELKQRRLEMQKEVDKVGAEESAYREHLINNVPKSKATGIAGKVARVTVYNEDVPTVKNWDKFYDYVIKNKAFDLLQRRLNAAAVEERWEAKKKIPGVEPFAVTKISLNKV